MKPALRKKIGVAGVGVAFVFAFGLAAPVKAVAADATATQLANLDRKISVLDIRVQTVSTLVAEVRGDLAKLDKYVVDFYNAEANRYQYYVQLHKASTSAADSAKAAADAAAAEVRSGDARNLSRYYDLVKRFDAQNTEVSNQATLNLNRYSDLASRLGAINGVVTNVQSAVKTNTDRIVAELRSIDVSGNGSDQGVYDRLEQIRAALITNAENCDDSVIKPRMDWWTSLVVPESDVYRPCSQAEDVARKFAEFVKRSQAAREAAEKARAAKEFDERVRREIERRQREAEAQEKREELIREVQGLGEAVKQGFRELTEKLNEVGQQAHDEAGKPDISGFPGSGLSGKVQEWGNVSQCLAISPGSTCKAWPISFFGMNFHLVDLCGLDLSQVHKWRDFIGAVMMVMVGWTGFMWIIAAFGVAVPARQSDV